MFDSGHHDVSADHSAHSSHDNSALSSDCVSAMHNYDTAMSSFGETVGYFVDGSHNTTFGEVTHTAVEAYSADVQMGIACHTD